MGQALPGPPLDPPLIKSPAARNFCCQTGVFVNCPGAPKPSVGGGDRVQRLALSPVLHCLDLALSEGPLKASFAVLSVYSPICCFFFPFSLSHRE